MAEFRLGRIKFIWKGDWQAGLDYVKDDVIRNNGKMYVCTITHTANADFNYDADFIPPRWNLMGDGQEWRGDWDNNVVYQKGDIAKYGGNLYICKIGHQSASTDTLGLEVEQVGVGQDSSLSKWDLYAESFDWKGDWVVDYRYKLNDVVKYGGNIYLCNEGHTSAGTIAEGLEGLDRVTPGSKDDIAKWDIHSEGFDWKTDWTPSTRYKINDVVKFGGTLYICNEGHTAGIDFAQGLEQDQSKWDYFNQGIEYKEQWDPQGVNYKVNDIVKYGASLYICVQKNLTDHSRSFEQDEDSGYWEPFVEGFEFENSWNVSNIYQPGDIVTYGGYAYVATQNHTGIAPTTPTTGALNWDLYTTGFSLKNDWDHQVSYKVGDVVRVNGYTYVAVADSPSLVDTVTATASATDYFTITDTTDMEPGMSVKFSGSTFAGVQPNVTYYIDTVVNGTTFTISSLQGGVKFEVPSGSGSMTVTVAAKPPNTDYWERLNSGFRWRGQWLDDVDYVQGDVVRFGPSSFVCILAHHSESDADSTLTQGSINSRPDQDLTGTYWNLLAAGSENSVLTTQGDMVIYSGAGPARLPIGGEGQTLTVTNSLPAWKYWGVIDQLYFVGVDGVDGPAPNRGLTSDRPWKTVRYAAEQVDRGPRNPNAAELIRRNRGWIADETVEWIDDQITNNTAPFATGFSYNKVKCRRDVGLVIDALIWDITHGGNVETRKATLEYINNGSQVYILGQEAETVAALTYAIDDLVLQAVLTNSGPASTYGSINQYINLSYTTETQATAEITDLKAFLYAGILSGDAADVPAQVIPQTTILVKTGVYYETLPIRVPQSTAIVGDELRSTNIRPAGQLVQNTDVTYTTAALNYIKTIVTDVMSSNLIGAPLQTNVIQYTNANMAGIVTTSTGVDTVKTNTDLIYDIIDNGAGSIPGSYTMPAPHFATAEQTGAHVNLLANVTFLEEELGAWLADAANGFDAVWNGLTVDEQATFKSETGYIVEALAYDIRYGGNTQTNVMSRSYYNPDGTFIKPIAQKPATLAAYAYLKTIIDDIVLGNLISKTAGNGETQDNSNTDADAATASAVQDLVQEIYDTIDDVNNLPAEVNVTTTAGGTTLLIENQISYTKLQAVKEQIKTDGLEFVKSTFPTLVFNHALCSRDIGYVVDAVARDVLFEADFASVVAGRRYLAGTASAQLVLTSQKDAQLALVTYLKHKMKFEAAYGSDHAVELLTDMVGYISTGTRPYLTGSISQNTYSVLQNGADLLYANKDFIAEEAVKYIDNTYPAYASQYDHDACKRDIREFMEAIWKDIKFTGSYNSIYAARFYYNAVHGCLEEDMYYVRNGTGIRNMTVQGLTGTLGPANIYGTRRPSAGAYVSLDPGWGPNDTRAWTTNKSCYVQNVTTFGTGCVGCKIDGSLHNGGNDSIVSNDFTQVLSDGIGVWCTNLGRTELVSVFSYYGHIGYLAENGGKIRATNGNSSYGTFGTVSEGVDITEVPVTGTVDNRARNAGVTQVGTSSGGQVQRLEFANAGTNYQNATIEFNGPGANAIVEEDEYRDGAVFEVRMLDLNDSSGQFGGQDYVQIENVAQGGTLTEITISATDSQTNNGYNGNLIYIQSGLGAGQYAYITAYNAGSKVATVAKYDGTSGWDHAVPGTTIVPPDPSSLYIIEPRITFTAPVQTVGTNSFGSATVDAEYVLTKETFTGIAHTAGVGNNDATFNVTRDGFNYTVSINVDGTGYSQGNTLVIPGTSIGGNSPAHDITITVNQILQIDGAIDSFTAEGYSFGGMAMVIGTSALYKIDKDGVGSLTNPAGGTWTAIAAGNYSGNTATTNFALIAGGSTATVYSTDYGANWTAGTTPTSQAWSSIAFGADRFVAVATDSDAPVVSVDGGVNWANGGDLATSVTGWTDIVYGKNQFVAISNTGVAVRSSNGNAWVSFTGITGSPDLVSVEWGNGRYIALASTGETFYSIDGAAFVAGPTITGSNFASVDYKQGLFVVTNSSTNYWTSEDGQEWTVGTGTLSGNTSAMIHTNVNRSPKWYCLGANGAGTLVAGATAKGRARVTDGKVVEIRLWEPGSSYTSAPTITITDPNNVYEAPTEVRIGNGAIGNPSFINRGIDWSTATATVTGDGYGDYFQAGSYIDVKGLPRVPVPGSNVEFSTLPGQYFKLVTVTQVLGEPGPYSARFQLSPAVQISESPPHGDTFEVRIRYSQCRLTGHDFLDIGTGNFTNTNYPNLPLQDPVPASETNEAGGGRVFFTSTDQDGNFRVGDLFTVEQATGTATLNADAFNIAGLQELQLGSVELGTGGVAINEFSTDPFFTQDSDAVIPTQRAIKAYIASQIGSGSSTLNVNTLTAGQVFVADNYITTTSGFKIDVETKLDFKVGVDGIPVAMNLFLHG